MKNNSTNNTIVDKLPANYDLTETPYYKIYRYYSTDIIRLESENKGLMITLFTGGHYSKSTQKHMIKFLAREGINVKIQFSSIWGYKVIYYKNGREEIYNFNKEDVCQFYA